MLQAVLLLVLLGASLLILQRQYSGRLVATPYAHLLYFLFVSYIGGFLLAGNYGLNQTVMIAFVGFATSLAALLGYLSSTSDIRGENSPVRRFADPSMRVLLEDRVVLLAVLFLGIFVILPLAAFYYQGLPPVLTAVLDFLTAQGGLSSLVEVRDARFELTKGAYFGGEYRGQGLIAAVLQASCMVLCSYAFARLALRRSAGNILGAVTAVLVAWIAAGGAGDRAPFLEVLVVAVSAFSLCRPIRPRLVVILLVGFMALVLVTSLYSTKSMILVRLGYSDGFADLFWRNLERIFVGNSINDARVVELVESGRWELRNGAVHLRNLITALPGVNYGRPVAYELFAYFNPHSNATTFFSGTYLTAAYLDFGRIGAAFAFFVCGAFVGLTERLIFTRRRTSAIQFIFFPLISFFAAKIIVYGPTELLSTGVVLLTLFGLLLAFDSVVRNFLTRRKPVLVAAA